MSDAHPIAIPKSCPTCGQAPVAPACPEVERWNRIAAGLYREARAAAKGGRPKAAISFRRRGLAALERAVEAQIEAEDVAGVCPL